MQSDIRLLTPTTLVLDSLTITEIKIDFYTHNVYVTIRDQREVHAVVTIANGGSTGMTYAAGAFTSMGVNVQDGFTAAIAAMSSGALPGLAAYMLASGYLVVEGGAEAFSPVP